jgi:hypothetical protein
VHYLGFHLTLHCNRICYNVTEYVETCSVAHNKVDVLDCYCLDYIVQYETHRDELYNVCSLSTGICLCTEERPRRGWEDNIKMDLQELECGGVDWIELAQDRNRWRALLNAVMSLRIP